jgi:hypothetical protein
MRNILFRIWGFFTGATVPKPGLPPAGCVWKWDVFEQCWVPTIDRARDNFPRKD